MSDKVLIVDDDPIIQKILTIGLNGSGFETRVAASGLDAIDMVSGSLFAPDCILLDIRMPGLPGNEVLQILKKRAPITPVIMLTATTELETAVDMMKMGAFDYILKPARKIYLEETIRKAIRFRDILRENQRLERENREYQKSLEIKVEERTAELFRAYTKLQQANLETVQVLAETIEAKDPYTRGHCNRVRLVSMRIAEQLQMGKKEIEILEYGSLLHDIGKIGVSEKLLNKNGRLDEQERGVFQIHPLIGTNILSTVEFFHSCLPVVRHHHEWYNGKGYPDRLEGERIDINARIVAIADSFDAMSSNRPYRPAMPLDLTLKELEQGKGSQFDPRLIDIFFAHKLYSPSNP